MLVLIALHRVKALSLQCLVSVAGPLPGQKKKIKSFKPRTIAPSIGHTPAISRSLYATCVGVYFLEYQA